MKAKQGNLEADWIQFRQFRNNVISKIRNRKTEFLKEIEEEEEKSIRSKHFETERLSLNYCELNDR